MKTKILAIILMSLALIISCGEKEYMEDKIDSIFSEFGNGITPGACITIMKSGNVIYEKSFGYADLGKEKKIEPKTNFRLASIIK